MNTKLYSHPDVLLETHLKNVHQKGKELFIRNGLYLELQKVMEIALVMHDFGKASSFFQEYLLSASHTSSKYTKHSEVSAIITYQYLLEDGVDEIHAILAYNAIRCHHKDLDDFREMQQPDLSKDDLLQIVDAIDFQQASSVITSILPYLSISKDKARSYIRQYHTQTYTSRAKGLCKKLSEDLWFLQKYIYSILISSDKNDAIFQGYAPDEQSTFWQSSLVDSYRNSLIQNTSVLSNLRSRAYQTLSNADYSPRIMAISLPTGAGKTISSLRAALGTLEKDSSLQRIVYCLPFTSIIDQNFDVFRDILLHNDIPPISKALLSHHHLSEFSYQDNETSYFLNKAEYLMETWDSELVVTTFYQFLAALFSPKNRNTMKFHRLANSIIILDEVQSIPHRFWRLLNRHLLSIAERMNIRIILVTATMPLIFDSSQNEITHLIPDFTSWFSLLDRINLNTEMLHAPQTIADYASFLISKIKENKGKSHLVILNTVKSSLALYQLLKEELSPKNLLYLSSNVIPLDRLQRIKDIRTNKGKEMIVISTQVVEAGVDIDIDFVYRDLAPLDCIIQACGRCNRNQQNGVGNVMLIRLKDERKEYWKYIYDATLVDATLKTLSAYQANIAESSFYELVQGYYHILKSRTSDELSETILHNIESLKYSEVDKAIQLIEGGTRSVFVELNTDATEVYRQYIETKSAIFADDYQKKAAIKSAFRKLSPFMINVHSKQVQSGDPFFVITADMLHFMYDTDTGFKRTPEISDYIL